MIPGSLDVINRIEIPRIIRIIEQIEIQIRINNRTNRNTDMKIENKNTVNMVFWVHSLQMNSSEDRFPHYNHDSLSKGAVLTRLLLRTATRTLKLQI